MDTQKKHWDRLHERGLVGRGTEKPTAFALEVSRTIPARSKILELGCGAGTDARFFAARGHEVVATDFSPVAIRRNAERQEGAANPAYAVLDMEAGIGYPAEAYDAVYARLSLHYFPDAVTRRIIRDIHRILKPGGYLCFLCKSADDILYGLGTELETDLYEFRGHVRHFFRPAYAASILEGLFDIRILEEGKDVFYGQESAFVKVIAVKTNS